MPELPEVEIIARLLGKVLTGRKIESAELRREKLAPANSFDDFAARLADTAIESVGRRGKHILFHLSNGNTLITHLRMSGRFSLLEADRDDPKFSHAVFHLDGDERLVFSDQRHFGMMKIVSTAELFLAPELAKLAPEPFSDDFDDAYLRTALASSRRPVKLFLLDQTKVCGVGNIYASEALFLSRVHPERAAKRVGKTKISLLRQAILDVLDKTLALGANISVDREDIGGNLYDNGAGGDWYVYGREGEDCPACGTTIMRMVQGGRSTFFCRQCQRR